MKRKLTFAIWSIALFTSPAVAQEVRFDSVPTELRPRYEAQKADIEALVAKIGNKNLSGDERAARLNELQLRYPYVSLPVASSVALVDLAPLQLAATRILANSVVMMNHPSNDHAMHTKATLAILKQVVKTGTPQARSLAAQLGASLGDKDILCEIKNENSKGSLSDVEAVSYFTLAEPKFAAEYVNEYLKRESVPAAKKQAIAYLGALPEYQNDIRQQYLFASTPPTVSNKPRVLGVPTVPSVPPVLQAAAARVLARTDDNFPKYVDKIIKRNGTPVEVVNAIIRGSIENEANPVNAEQILRYKIMVNNYENANPGVNVHDLNAIQKQIQILQ